MAPSPIIKFLRLRPESDSDIALPRYMTSQSAGMDICAAVTEEVLLEQGEIAMLPTGRVCHGLTCGVRSPDQTPQRAGGKTRHRAYQFSRHH